MQQHLEIGQSVIPARILVIEDDALQRKSIRKALEAAGFVTLEAEDGEAGLSLARAHHPDLVLCDIRMEGLGGYDVLRALRAHPGTAAIPCILMTGMADQNGMREGMKLGADDYLPKPFSVSDLLASVRARLEKHHVIRQQAEEKMEALRHSITLALPHELRTPLHTILGYAQLLMTGGDMSPDEVVEYARRIYHSGNRLHRLIENFLVYVRIEMQVREVEMGRPFVRSYCSKASVWIERVARHAAEERGRLGDLRLDLVECDVAMSEEYLERILAELLDNAFKFSEPGMPVEVRVWPDGDRFILEVQDRGRGIGAEQRAHIGAYMQFERALHEQQGAGLGLQIVRRLVDLHGGVFDIDGTPGAGTTVRITLDRSN